MAITDSNLCVYRMRIAQWIGFGGCSGMHLFFSLPDTRKHIGSEVVVFHFFNTLLDDFA